MFDTKELSSFCIFAHFHLRAYSGPHLAQGEGGVIKMSNLFKNEFCYIIEKTCTALLHMLEYIPGAYDEVAPRNPYMLKYIPDHKK